MLLLGELTFIQHTEPQLIIPGTEPYFGRSFNGQAQTAQYTFYPPRQLIFYIEDLICAFNDRSADNVNPAIQIPDALARDEANKGHSREHASC